MGRHPRRWRIGVMAALLAASAAAGGPARAAQLPPPPPVPDQGPAADAGPDDGAPQGAQVLTRGPIHEAFAEPVVYDPRPGPIVPKQPPAPIVETPPDQQPEGNVAWIPGYWAWDDERQDFIWISGLWREPPPGRQWVPGYWSQVDQGFQWVPGSWAPVDQDPGQAQYLPAPPESLEQGPSSPQPQGDFTWAPGNWVWNDNRYAWQPGYWVPAQPDWVWTPSSYTSTPNGYLYNSGYWDYSVARRGQLFAPMYFQQPSYLQPNFSYTPSIGLLGTSLLSSLFIRPQNHQYYFGDYYGANNFQSGIYPYYAYHQSRYGYDPIYAHAAAIQGRDNPQWASQIHDQYVYRRQHPEARPPRTYIEQRNLLVNNTNINNTNINNTNVNNVRNVILARPLAQLAARTAPATGGAPPIRFQRVDPARRDLAMKQSAQLQQFREQRLRQEQAAGRNRPPAVAGAPRPAPEPRPGRLDLPKSPIAAVHPSEPGRVAPPTAPPMPRVEHAVQPRPAGEPPRRFEPHPEMRPPWPPHAAPAPVAEARPVPAPRPAPPPAAAPRPVPPRGEPMPRPASPPPVAPRPAPPRVEPAPQPAPPPPAAPRPAAPPPPVAPRPAAPPAPRPASPPPPGPRPAAPR